VNNPAVLHDLLDNAARDFAGAPAVTVDGETVSYAGLAELSRRAAAWLAGMGVRCGDRVVIAAPQRLDTVSLLYGCSRLGAVFVILHEQVRGRGLEHVLDDAEPGLAIADDPGAPAAGKARGIPVVTSDVAARGVTGARADGPPGAAGHPRRAGHAGPDGTATTAGHPGPLAVDPVCFIYTSGSTGLPKAVVCTHGQVLYAAQAIQGQLRYGPGDVVFVVPPLSFDYGLYQLFLAAQGGAHVVLAATSAGPSLLRDLRRSEATVLPALPSLAANLARMLDRHGGTLGLRLLTNTGAVMSPDVLTALRSHIPVLRVQLMFGLTECKRVSIMPPDEDLVRPGACGRALPGTTIEIQAEDGRPMPPGQVGEIVVRGPHVMSGYWRRPELTAQRFRRREGLFAELHTGDYGRLDEDGYLYFSGRRDDIYKSRGFRVSGTEIEASAVRLGGVAGAVLVPPGPGRPSAVLFVAGPLTPRQVLSELRADIEPYKVPEHCVVIPALPLNANGKPDRAALERDAAVHLNDRAVDV